jgi:hypothetical protein
LQITLTVSCNPCDAGYGVHFDDVAVTSGFAPNPGFEGAGGWTILNRQSSLVMSGVQAHGGSSSAAVTGTVNGSGQFGIVSDCIAVAPAGSYLASGWYTTVDGGLTLSLRVDFFGSTSCSGTPTPGISYQEPAPSDSAWHRVEAAGLAPAGTQALRTTLTVSCNACLPDQQVSVDDVGVQGGRLALPTAAGVLSFTARREGRFAVVRWRTGAEREILAYELWRNSVRVTAKPIAATGGVRRTTYSVVDRQPLPGRAYVYRLESINPRGTRRSIASTRLSPNR